MTVAKELGITERGAKVIELINEVEGVLYCMTVASFKKLGTLQTNLYLLCLINDGAFEKS